MRFEYSDTLDVNNRSNAVEVVTSGLITNRKNIEVEKQNIHSDTQAEVVLRYTGHKNKDCETRHIVVSTEDDQITVNAIANSDQRASGLEVGIKSIVRNIRSSIAGRVDAEL